MRLQRRSMLVYREGVTRWRRRRRSAPPATAPSKIRAPESLPCCCSPKRQPHPAASPLPRSAAPPDEPLPAPPAPLTVAALLGMTPSVVIMMPVPPAPVELDAVALGSGSVQLPPMHMPPPGHTTPSHGSTQVPSSHTKPASQTTPSHAGSVQRRSEERRVGQEGW